VLRRFGTLDHDDQAVLRKVISEIVGWGASVRWRATKTTAKAVARSEISNLS
jgi:hypothetical protein